MTKYARDGERVEVEIPEGIAGIYSIAVGNERSYSKHKPDDYESTTYLWKHGITQPIMQNSPAEFVEHEWLWNNMIGDVLIGGLGLGMVNHKLIESDVTSVTIIEKEQDVVDLVWENCPKDNRFTLLIEDVETWVPTDGLHWDVGWFDTWLSDNPLSIDAYSQLVYERYSPYIDKIETWKG
tara:strand:- start:272 stop:814 length:543 start_codon:yes stop_codon:yes gene_type:complete